MAIPVASDVDSHQNRAIEPILTDTRRYTLFPIVYKDLWDLYKQARQSYWTPDEVDITKDKQEWETRLNANERKFLGYILAFFASADSIVGDNILSRFAVEVKVPEAAAFYAFQAAMEAIHQETYSLLIDTYITDSTERDMLFRAIETIDVVKQKAAWAERYITSSDSFATRLIAFIAIEGVFFSGSFASIFWLKSRGLMTHGLGTSNEFISRDEGLHVQFGVALYNHIVNRLTQGEVEAVFRSAVEIEEAFFRDALSINLIGMNYRDMMQYIHFVADYLLVMLGYERIYHVTNPFSFMEMLNMQGKTNFFEKRVTEYKMMNSGDMKFTLDADF